ncbi:MAG: hypothetical protein WD960_09270 [Gemmatimonadota bacterium]
MAHDRALWHSGPTLPLRLPDQGAHVQGVGAHEELPVLELPAFAGAVRIDLDPQPVRIQYQQLSGGGALEGDTLWLHDRARNRILLFTLEGEYRRAIAYDRPGGAAQIRYVRVLPGGPIVDLATTMGGDALSRATDGSFEERILLDTVSRTGEEVELVSDLPGGVFEMQTMDLPRGQRGVTIRNTAPSLSLPHQVEVGPDASVWITDAEAFELRRLDLDGALREVFRVQAPRTPVTPALVEEHERLLLEQVPPEAREGVEAGFAVREYAAILPPIGRLVADDTGLLWVSEYTGHRPGEQPRVWWVIEPEGDLLGRVEVPEGFRVLQIGVDEVLGVVQDKTPRHTVPSYAAGRLKFLAVAREGSYRGDRSATAIRRYGACADRPRGRDPLTLDQPAADGARS